MIANKNRKQTLWVSVIGVVGVTLLLWLTVAPLGLTWDEPAYMRAAASYHEWVARLFSEGSLLLKPAILSAYWDYNHEHPPVVKLWYALVGTPLVKTLGLVGAYRFAAMMVSAMLVTVVVVSSLRVVGGWVALAAGIVLLCMPRFFMHAHVAALDVPGALAYIAANLFFWHMRNRREWWVTLLFGVIWGVGIATKINAAFVLPTIGLWWLMYDRRGYLLGRMVLGGLVALVVFVALWPWLWVDTVTRLTDYLLWVTVAHWQIPQWFLGQSLLPPPWYFAPVMAVMVTPLVILLVAVVGGVVAVPAHRSYLHLIVLSAVIPLCALMVSSTVYDNERLFMAFFPMIAVLAGYGLTRGVLFIKKSADHVDWRVWLVGLVLMVGLPIRDGVRMWPHLLSYYSESIGGLPGAARLDMDHTYWNETYVEAFDYLNVHAPTKATVWIESYSYDVPHTYQLDGRTRADLRFVSNDGYSAWGMNTTQMAMYEADYVIVTYRFAYWTPATRALVASNTPPVYEIVRDGVPLLRIYRQP